MGKASLGIMIAAGLGHYMGYTPYDALQVVKDNTPTVDTLTSLLGSAKNYGIAAYDTTKDNVKHAVQQTMAYFVAQKALETPTISPTPTQYNTPMDTAQVSNTNI